MEKEVTVSFYLKKSEKKKDGSCPIMAKLSVGKASTTIFSIKLSIPENLWSGGWATGKSQLAASINHELDALRGDARKHYRELIVHKAKVSAEDVKYRLQGMAYGQETLLSYFHTHNENFQKRIGVNRAKGSECGYQQALKHLIRFLNEKYRVSDIPFSALDRSFIDKFDLYLKIDRGLMPGTIVMLTTRLNTIISNAKAEGILHKDPFADYHPERPKPRQKSLTREELDLLMKTELNKSRHFLIRDLFLFSCYTGIPYCDRQRRLKYLACKNDVF